MPPSDNNMNDYIHHFESSNNLVASSTIQQTLTKDDQTIPQLSFDGLLHQGGDLDLASCKLPFVWKLFEMLEGVEKSGDEHIVSWLDSGKAFRVHKLEEFVNNIVPIYFKQSKYKSFQRQLNFYGFTRVTTGPNAGAYYHSQFLKGQKTLCLSIRPKATPAGKKSPVQKKSTKTTPPSFQSNQHWMPQIQNLLTHGAEHSLRQQQQDFQVVEYHRPQQQQQQYQTEPTVSSAIRLPVEQVPQYRTEQEDQVVDEDFQDGDAVIIFGNMSFHFVGNQ